VIAAIFRLEVAWQLRRRSTWFYFGVVFALSMFVALDAFVKAARRGGFFFNSPFVIAAVTVIAGMIGLLATAAIAGDAATRDVQARMEPLVLTTPVRRAAYAGGRFAGAFAVNALLIASVPLALMFVARLPGSDVIGPFRIGAYVSSYLLFALPNAFVGAAILFALATMSRRAVASYVGAAMLLIASTLSNALLAKHLNQWTLGKLLDPLGLTVLSELSRAWAPAQKNAQLIAFDGALLWNRVLWIAIALAALALSNRRRTAPAVPAVRVPEEATPVAETAGEPVVVAQDFGPASRLRQTLAIAARSFREVATSWGAIALAAIAVVLIVTAPQLLTHIGVPMLPTTARLATLLASSGDLFCIIAPLLAIFYAGELVWRERDARMHVLTDITPNPDWLPLLGKFIGLGLALAAFQTLIMLAGIAAQLGSGYYEFQLGVYLKMLFGFELSGYLLLAALAIAVHVLVKQKYVAHFVLVLLYAFTAFAPALGVEQKLLIFGSDPGWQYSDMRGFAPFVAGVVWFRIYWAAWAWLLMTFARSRRISIPALVAIVAIGGFLFRQTNVRNLPTAPMTVRAPQPLLTATSLRVELYPERGDALIRGTYRLENREKVAIDTIHVATASGTDEVKFDRGFTRAGNAYRLSTPLQPGESTVLSFSVHYERRGFSDPAVVRNGTILGQEWLPQIGNQSGRERIAFDAIVGTAANETALAPGALQRTWIENRRRYCHYVADAPIRNEYAFYSSEYAVRRANVDGIGIEVFHHPAHDRNVDAMIRSASASLRDYSAKFGAYPYRELRLIEIPEDGVGLHSNPTSIWYSEGFASLNPAGDPRNVDFPFAVLAHEVAHQWWGNQLTPADAPGAPVLTESLAWYSAMGVVERTYGAEHLRRFLDVLREAYLSPRSRADVPLMQANDWFVAYRKGPFAMYALREYLGDKTVTRVMRRLIEQYGSGTPRPTTADLYSELQRVTPQSLQYLLADLFKVNTFWELSTKSAHAERVNNSWRVTLNVSARKVAVDTKGVETERPMRDPVEIGIYGANGKPLYLRMHEIVAGTQQLTIDVPAKPASAAIDPRHLLIDTEPRDNGRGMRDE